MRVENLVCRCFYNRCDLFVNVEKINSTRVLIDGISLNTTNFVLFLSGFTTHFSNFIHVLLPIKCISNSFIIFYHLTGMRVCPHVTKFSPIFY